MSSLSSLLRIEAPDRPRSAARVAYFAALLILALGLWQIWRAREAALVDVQGEVRNLASSLAQHAGRTVESVDLVLSGVVDRLENGMPVDAAFKRFLERRVMDIAQVRHLAVTDAQGDWISDSVREPPAPVDSRDRASVAWHRDHPDRVLHLGEPIVDQETRTASIPLSRRWNKPDGSFGGVVAAALAPESLQAFYAKLAVGERGSIALISTPGRILVRHPFSPGAVGRDVSGEPLFRDLLPRSPTGISIQASPVDGEPRIAAYEVVTPYPLVAFVAHSIPETLVAWRSRAIADGLVCGLVVLTLVALGLRLSRHERRTVAAERAVRENEARYRLLAETTSDVITRLDLDFTRDYVSPSCRTLFGYEPEELLGRRPSAVMHPADAPAVREQASRLAAGEVPGDRITAVYRTRHKRGYWIWIEAGMSLARREDGAPAAIVCSLRDVTARREAEEALAESEARYRLLADHASDLIVLGHADGRRSYISPAVTRLLGYTVEEAHRLSMREWLHPDDRAQVFATTAGLTPDRPLASVVYRLRHRDGHYIWAEAAFQRVEDGADIRIITAIRDVTERQRQAAHLERARVEAEAGARIKAEFLANMSHELRTPLTGMLGVHDLLQSDPTLGAAQRRYVRLAQEAGRSLLTIVNDILDLSKIEAGEMAIEHVPFVLRDLLESCRQIAAEAAPGGVTLALQTDEDVPHVVHGDPTRVRQVLLNLVTNAVKFTPQGRVTVQVSWPAQNLRVAVTDTGIGIAPEVIPHLFERFSQADGSTARRFGGTGLGLAICKRLVALMGGTIGVASVPGQGSTFWFTLPLTPAASQDRPGLACGGEAAAGACDWRVLLVEDNRINQEIIRTVLARRGCRVAVAEDGLAAVETFRRDRFDLVLMDVQMPGMDGLAATRAIRAVEQAEGRRRTPLVALTANALAEEATRCRAAGMDAHVAKPIAWADLFAVCEQLCGHPQAGEPGDGAAADGGACGVLDERVLQELAGLLGGPRVGQLLAEFQAEMEERLRLLDRAALPAADLAAHTHALVSLAGQLGFLELSRLSARLEARAGSGVPPEEITLLRAAAHRAITAAAASHFAKAA